MKIQMQGSELKNTDIEIISLVKRGANRAPFKVIKAEGVETGVMASLGKFFQLSEPTPRVAAVFVEKSALVKSLPNLALAGFDLKDHEQEDSVFIFKQEGWDDCKTVIMLKSDPKVFMAVSNVSQYADTFSGSLSFDAGVSHTGCYPGVNSAMAALQHKIGEMVAKSTDGAATQVQAELQSFTKYVTELYKALPESVWKFETLQRGFGSDTTVVNVDGDSKMNPTEIVKSAEELAAKLLKAANGGKKGGAQDQAAKQTGSSSSETDQNSSSSELAGSSDDSPDDDAAKKALMAKTGNTVKDGLDESGVPEIKKDDKGNEFLLVKDAKGAETQIPVLKDAERGAYVCVKHADGKIVKYSPGAKIPAGSAYTTQPWEQDGALGGTNNGNGQGQGKAKASETADDELNHTGAGGMKKEEVEALLTNLSALPQMVGDLAKLVKDQSETLTKTTQRLEAVEKTAKEVVSKSERAVIHAGPVHDSAYENLGGGQRRVRKTDTRTQQQIAKAEFPESIWEGTLGVMERHIVGEGEIESV